MAETGAIRVLIVDDHDMLRCGLSLFIYACTDLRLVGEACNGRQAVDLCNQLQPDVVLMDLVMPDMDGIEATRLIRDQNPSIQVVALSSFGDESLVTSVLTAGALSYLLKNVSIAELNGAIHDAYAHKARLAPEAAQALVDAQHRPPPPNFALSAREQQVLRLLIRGLSNMEIANHLTIGVSTVKKHVSNIFAKMDIGTRAEAAVLAVRYHLVDD